MARRRRNDSAGTWHHVFNRGLARRTFFETETDVRYFLSRVAREVRAGRIEIHAYTVLTTHFHLLVRSRTGELSAVLQRIQNDYSRWFNRGRGRDGPLYSGRFRSKRANALDYRTHLVRYIDFNPVRAGLTTAPPLYPHGSARRYAELDGPIWMERAWVEGLVVRLSQSASYRPESYAWLFGDPLTAGQEQLLERRIEQAHDGDEPFCDLIEAAPPSVLAWMRSRAALADGTRIGVPICNGETVDALMRDERGATPSREERPRQVRCDEVTMRHVALLRDLCGATLREAGARTGTSTQSAWKRYLRHQRRLEEDAFYARRCGELAKLAIGRCHGRAAIAGSEG